MEKNAKTRKKWFLTEAGFYSFIITCRSNMAKEFKKWVVKDVLPSIRKTGSYTLANKTNIQLQQINSNLENHLKIKDEKMKELELTLTDKTATIQSKNETLRRYETVIAGQDGAIHRLQQETSVLRQDSTTKKRKIDRLYDCGVALTDRLFQTNGTAPARFIGAGPIQMTNSCLDGGQEQLRHIQRSFVFTFASLFFGALRATGTVANRQNVARELSIILDDSIQPDDIRFRQKANVVYNHIIMFTVVAGLIKRRWGHNYSTEMSVRRTYQYAWRLNQWLDQHGYPLRCQEEQDIREMLGLTPEELELKLDMEGSEGLDLIEHRQHSIVSYLC